MSNITECLLFPCGGPRHKAARLAINEWVPRDSARKRLARMDRRKSRQWKTTCSC
jgi:hypothetical protein